ncbi:MAG: hypothetical protein C3F13_19125 [Anaerolineales bacterium]|nr:hypothetical protein [Anaerolineae bacterium]PWB49513.1 MAG: hypothetical protein C3F13_19125 [Anaerolineales bacterium]
MKRVRADKDLELTRQLANRLEHLSVDSTYAHRASGLRGSLLRYIERMEAGEQLDDGAKAGLEELVQDGYTILEMAAKEIGAKR